MPPFQRVQRSKTSCVKTDSVDSVFFVFSRFFVCLFFCREVCSTCKYVLSDRTLYVALSRSCPYCMRCSEWKTGIKKALYFVSESQGLSFVHILDENCIYSQQRPSGGSSLMLSALLHVVWGVSQWKCCAAGVFDCLLLPLLISISSFLPLSSQLCLSGYDAKVQSLGCSLQALG